MAFFAKKVRRKVPGNFTFLLLTDRNDLDSQICKTFVGCGIAGNDTPHTASGDDLERILKENNQYVFSLILKFNKDVDPKKPFSERDDIIVISDEAHRTQAGRLARNMRLALPSAAFTDFTGTPLFKQEEITKRIFGEYVSRYDFKRSEEDGATVKQVQENRGEKLGVAKTDLNDRIAEKIEEAELDPDQAALLDKLLGNPNADLGAVRGGKERQSQHVRRARNRETRSEVRRHSGRNVSSYARPGSDGGPCRRTDACC